MSVAGYSIWPESIAHFHVYCDPRFRRRGYAARALEWAITDACAAALLPQYQARDTNQASIRVSERMGFAEYGWMATVRINVRNVDGRS